MSKVDGGPAFPRSGNWSKDYDGMSLRDWYAGMALQGYLSGIGWMDENKVAKWSYAQADAMLVERSK